jgi:hypothetical protein
VNFIEPESEREKKKKKKNKGIKTSNLPLQMLDIHSTIHIPLMLMTAMTRATMERMRMKPREMQHLPNSASNP